MDRKEVVQTPKDLLIAARQLISDEKKWTKYAWARRANGSPAIPGARSAVCWCADGALLRKSASLLHQQELLSEAYEYVNKVIDESHPSTTKDRNRLAWVNDYYGHTAVLEVLDRAIELAGEDNGV